MQIGTAHPRIRIVGVEPGTTVHTFHLDVVAEAVDTLHTLDRIVESQLTVFERTKNKSAAELVENITHPHGIVVILPLDILRGEIEVIGSGLLADLISLQCREISVNLESRRKTTVHVVEFHVVVRTETIVGSSACCTQSRVVLVVDRVALETTGELALPHANLRRNGKRRQECKRQAKQFFQHIGIFFRFKE